MAAGPAARRTRDAAALLSLQALLLLGFGLLARYDASADARKAAEDPDHAKGWEQDHATRYPMFQDVHVMIFVGFGFLMTFLRRYGYSAVGFNLLLGALVVQWAVLCRGLFGLDPDRPRIRVSLTSLLEADLAAAAVLISFGAVLGKTSPLQLAVMGALEVAVAAGNEHLGLRVLQAPDCGASMYVHVFGAYFGLAVSLVLGHGARIRKGEGAALEGATYTSDLFSMIGTVFLWMFWPSFNGALAVGSAQHRAVINTYLALASGCVCAFASSALLSRHSKFDMVHVQNATLAGGVAVGTAADLMLQPWGALLLGAVAGALSVLGYSRLQPWLLQRLRLHDTCGVHNLHGLPGVLAGLAGALAAALAAEPAYGPALYEIYPARAPENNSSALAAARHLLPGLEAGPGRGAVAQAGYQLLALGLTLLVALASGALVGLLLKLPVLEHLPADQLFSDEYPWEVAEEGAAPAGPAAPPAGDDDAKTDTTVCDARLHM